MQLPCTCLSSLRTSSQLLLLQAWMLLSCSSRSWPLLCNGSSTCRAAHFSLECKLLELKPLPMRRWLRALHDTELS